MEYAKDDIFKIRYNTKLNRLQIKEESWTSRLVQKIKTHKFLTTVIIVFLLFSTINIIMINSFMKILQSFNNLLQFRFIVLKYITTFNILIFFVKT